MSSALNVVQMEANRRNAPQSTGPRFSDEFLLSLVPETFADRQCAQTIIDTQWRLNRVRSLEDGMLALGHFGKEGQIDPGHPEIHAALTSAAVFREHSQAFVNGSMHEQRLYRMLKDASKSLEELKAKRIAARQADLDAAVALSNLKKMLGEPNSTNDTSTAGFVFKPAEIDIETAVIAVFWKPKSPRNAIMTAKKFRQYLAAQGAVTR